MNRRKWVAVVVIAALIALFVPFVPQTTASGQFLGAQYQHTATVLPSYYVFHCGSYIDSRYSTQLGAFHSFYQVARGYTFACTYNIS
jgi:hypothetical protein